MDPLQDLSGQSDWGANDGGAGAAGQVVDDAGGVGREADALLGRTRRCPLCTVGRAVDRRAMARHVQLRHAQSGLTLREDIYIWMEEEGYVGCAGCGCFFLRLNSHVCDFLPPGDRPTRRVFPPHADADGAVLPPLPDELVRPPPPPPLPQPQPPPPPVEMPDGERVEAVAGVAEEGGVQGEPEVEVEFLQARPFQRVPGPVLPRFLDACRPVWARVATKVAHGNHELAPEVVALQGIVRLLGRTKRGGRRSLAELRRRFDGFFLGELPGRRHDVERQEPLAGGVEGGPDVAEVRRASFFVKKGVPSKAFQALEGGRFVPVSRQGMAAIQALNPPRAEQLPNVPQAALGQGIAVDQDLLREVVANLPSWRAPGPSGMTYEHLQAMMKDQVCEGGILALVNAQLAGRYVPGPELLDGRSVGLLKVGGGVRPLVMQEVLARLALRVAAVVVTPEVTMGVLRPMQVGVGVASGAEGVVHATQLAFDQGGESCIHGSEHVNKH